MKRILITLYVWLLVSIPGCANAQSTKTINAEPKTPVLQFQSVEFLKQLPMPKLAEIQPLSLANFNYYPMGTYGNSYDVGQCTWGAASMKGNIPSNWGNANTWAINAQYQGYTVSSSPILGAVGVSYAGYLGHVVVVTGIFSDHIQITEMNYDGYGDGLWRTRDAAVGEFVYIYI